MKHDIKPDFNHFNPKLLLNPERKKNENPEKIIPIQYLKNKVVADFGCGSGFYSNYIKKFALKLYCIDPSKNLLDAAKKYIKLNNKNKKILFINSKISDVAIPFKSVDTGLLANVFHDIDPNLRKKSIKKIKQILKHDGILIVVEWKKVKTESGPPYKLRIDEKKCISYFIDLKFKIIKKFNVGAQQYCLILKNSIKINKNNHDARNSKK